MITIELPWPITALWPNRRAHWRTLHDARQAARDAAFYLAVDAGAHLRVKPCLIPVEIEFCPPSRRRFDRDNALAALKGHLDGVAEALGVDDSKFEPITLRRGEVVKGGKVIVSIQDGLNGH